MAKRKNRNRRNDALKRNRAIRAAEAREQRSQKNYANGELPKQITKGFLGRLSGEQLLQLAGRIGAEFDAQYIALVRRDSERYEAAPTVHITKLDREMAARPAITDEQIEAAPPRKRKTMRQQQRRRNAARQKIKKWQQYNAYMMMDYTVGEVRDMERRGESPFDVLGDMTVFGSARDELLRTRRNVLSSRRDRSHMRVMIRQGQREKVEKLLLDYAGIVGHATIPKIDTKQPSQKTGGKTTDYDELEQRLEAFDTEIQRAYSKLSPRQKLWLSNNTQFAHVLRDATWYDDNAKKWETTADGVSVYERLVDWIRTANER